MPSQEHFPFINTDPLSFTDQTGVDEEIITIEQATNLVQKFFKERPGFFTPYKCVPDFLKALVAPVGIPAILGVASALFLAGSAIAGVVSVGAFFVAAGAALFDADDLLISSLAVLAAAALTSGITALVGAALVLATVLSIPFTLTELVTRTVSSIVSPIVDVCWPEELDEPELSEVAYPTY